MNNVYSTVSLFEISVLLNAGLKPLGVGTTSMGKKTAYFPSEAVDIIRPYQKGLSEAAILLGLPPRDR